MLAALAPVSPDAIERWFSTGLYPVIQHRLTPLANALPVRVARRARGGGVRGGARHSCSRRQGRAAEPPASRLCCAPSRCWPRLPPPSISSSCCCGASTTAAAHVGATRRRAGSASGRRGAGARDGGRHSVERPSCRCASRGMGAAPGRSSSFEQAFVDVQRMLTDAPAATPGRLEGHALRTVFSMDRRRRHDQSVRPRGAVQSRPAGLRAAVHRGARVGAPRRLRGRIRGQLRGMADLHARRRAGALQRVAIPVLAD